MKFNFIAFKFLFFLSVFCLSQYGLKGQTTLFSDLVGVTYGNTDAVVADTYGSVDISNCSSVVFSFDYSFSQPWEGNGNMESPDECGSFGDCPGDVNMPDENQCDACWDFLLVDFLIDGTIVGGDMIGDIGTTDAEQSGTITATICTLGDNSTAQINTQTQNWAMNESVTYSNITIVCFEGLPDAQAAPDPVCANESLDLTGSVDDIGIVNNTNWTGPGNIDDASSLNTTVDGLNAGNPTFTLSSTDVNNCTSSADVSITVDPVPMPGNPDPIQICYSLSPIASEVLNLAEIIDQLTNFNAGLSVDWWFDAAATLPLDLTNFGDLQTLILTQPNTIYATVNDGICQSDVQAVSLFTDTYPNLSNTIGSLTECSNGTAVFNPQDANEQFTGGDATLIVTYYDTMQDAENDDNPILGNVNTANDLTIFVRVENSAGCPAFAELELIVGDAAIAFDSSLSACDDGSGAASFDLTLIENDILSGATGNVTFYEDLSGTIEIFIPDDYLSGSAIIYAIIDDGGNCFSNVAEIELSLISFNLAEASLSFSPTTACGPTDVSVILHTPLSPMGDYSFNISYGPLSTGVLNTVNVMGAEGEVGLLINVSEDYIFILNSVTSPAPNFCEQVFSMPIEYTITIDSGVDAFPAEMSVCPDNNGQGLFNLPLLNNTINGNSGNSVNFFEDMGLTTSINDPANFMSLSNTIYAVVDAGGGCTSAPVAITLTVNEAAVVSIALQQEISCNGDANAILDVSVVGNNPYVYDWSVDTWDGLSNITDVGPGVYTLIVTDANMCSSTADINVGEPAALLLNCNENTDMEGNGIGSYAFTYSGGTAPYTLNLDGPAAPNNFVSNMPDTWQTDVLPEGNYTFTITDDNDCSESCSFTIPASCNLVIDCSQTIPPSTPAGSNGGLNLIIAGGVAPYAVSWSGPVNGNGIAAIPGTFQITGLTVGAYTVTVVDANGCTVICGFVITNNPNCNFTAEINGINPSCNNSLDGSITFTLIEGTPDYTFTWSDASLNSVGINGDQTDLPAGDYAVTIIDQGGCSSMLDISLNAPPPILLSCIIISQPSQAGANDGSINIIINSGPTGVYTINYDNNAGNSGTIMGGLGNNIIPALPEGNFIIEVRNGNCQQSCQLTLSSSNCTFNLSILGVDESCEDGNDGTATATVSGGTPPYLFNWSNNETAIGIEGLEPGVYSLTVTDGAGCLALSTVTILAGTAGPTLTYGVPSTDICAGDCITLPLVLTGQPPYLLSYQIRANGESQNFELMIPMNIANLEICPADLGIPSGNFRLVFQVLMDGSCSRTLSEIIQMIYLPPVMGSYGETLCAGDSLLYEGVVFNENNPVGQVTLQGASSMGCDSLVDVSINFYPSITGSFDSILCMGSIMDFGGVIFDENNLNQQVTLQNASSMGCDSLVDVSISFYSLATGSFDSMLCIGSTMDFGGVTFDENNLSQQVILQDASSMGCDSLVDVSISFYSPAMGSFDSMLCIGSTMDFGGVIFDENNLSQQVILQNASSMGCDSLVDVSITFFGIADTIIEQSICQRDTLFFGGQAFYADQPVGNVLLENASVNGCDSTITVNLNVIPEQYGLLELSLCTGDTVIVEGQAFYDGLLTDSILLGMPSSLGCDTFLIVDIDLLQPGNYAVNADICQGDSMLIGGQFFHSDLLNETLILDNAAANGCDSIIEVNLNLLPVPTFDWAVQICQGDTLFIGQDMQTTEGMGTYLLEGMAANGCDSIVNTNVSFYETAESVVTPTACADAVIVIGDQEFDVDNPNGMVVLEGASANGCDSIITVNAVFLPNTVGSLDTVLCFGESLQIEGQTFNENAPNGFIVLENEAANGCDSTIFVSTSYREEMTARLTGDVIVCPNEEVTISLLTSNNFTYDYIITPSIGSPLAGNNQMGNQNFDLTPAQSTIYTLTQMTTPGDCPVTIQSPIVEVQVSELAINVMVLTDYNGFDISCPAMADGIAEVGIIDGIAPFSYQWSNGATTAIVNKLAVGNYTVTVTDAAGCSQEANISLSSAEPMIITAEGIAGTCFGDYSGQILLQNIDNGLPPYEYSLNGEFFSPVGELPQFIPQLSSGNHTLFLQDANDCITSVSVFVPEAEALIMELGDNWDIQLGDSVLLKPEINFTPVTWVWTPTDFLSQTDTFFTYASPTETSIYELLLIDENGCTARDTVRIFVAQELNIYIPSAFSPNGDGINDRLLIYAGLGVERIERFQIYDRWGGLKYSEGPFAPNDPTYGWDGKLDGEVLNAAIFVYFAEVRLITGKVILVKGDIMLMR